MVVCKLVVKFLADPQEPIPLRVKNHRKNADKD